MPEIEAWFISDWENTFGMEYKIALANINAYFSTTFRKFVLNTVLTEKYTLDDIENVIKTKNIHKLFFESHWMYRKHLAAMRSRMPVPIIFKIGVETFDRDFREHVLNKHADFQSPEEVAEYFDSPCLMVGIKGQTKEMIAHDIDCLKRYFKLGTVNVYNNNTTPIKRDEELVRWFMKEYNWLLDDPSVEVLYDITDFGVG